MKKIGKTTRPFRYTATAKSLQSCPTVRSHRRQPTRLPRHWDSPGKNTGVGCHFLLQCMKVKSVSEVTQSCPTLSDPADCSLPGSSIYGIFQARVLEWGAIAFYDLNQIHYDYTVELRNRFKGLDLIECLINYRQRFITLYRRQASRPSPWKRNSKKQNDCLRRPYK